MVQLLNETETTIKSCQVAARTLTANDPKIQASLAKFENRARQFYGGKSVYILSGVRLGQVAVEITSKGMLIFDIVDQNNLGQLRFKLAEFVPDSRYNTRVEEGLILASAMAIILGFELYIQKD